MTKKQLWTRLRNYHFDHLVETHLWDHIRAQFGGPDAFTKAFASKISRKLGWSQKFALKAIWEYKKFVYLGVVSDFSVTPPMVIDKVWHEHLLFSRGYREFCTEVIDYNFDHNPELLPADGQTATFNAQYEDTLELYKKEFAGDPPEEIWGKPKFDKALVTSDGSSSKKKQNSSSDIYWAEAPLYSTFYDDVAMHTNSFPEFTAFGGGDGGNSGAGSSWNHEDDDSDSDSDNDGDSGGDDSGSDGGGSDGGSSCSSGCAGGD
jgi:hypothetical protein